jgi:hypothetical protein
MEGCMRDYRIRYFAPEQAEEFQKQMGVVMDAELQVSATTRTFP